MAENTLKKHVDYANQQVDEQAILDKYNAATAAQFDVQREQNRIAENNFYNQMYNTQKTAMDTIRQSNAAAVSSGASRGIQAANELSALLGLQSESIASATELAQANRQTAQEETAAMLENVLNAYQQAQQERMQYVQHAIESESVDVQREANAVQQQANVVQQNANELNAENVKVQNQIQQDAALQSALETGPENYLIALDQQGIDYATEASVEGYQSLGAVLNTLPKMEQNDFDSLWARSWGGSNDLAQQKNRTIQQTIKQICTTYGLNYADYSDDFTRLRNVTKIEGVLSGTKGDLLTDYDKIYNALISKIKIDYQARIGNPQK
jgi:hypothetical protein